MRGLDSLSGYSVEMLLDAFFFNVLELGFEFAILINVRHINVLDTMY